MCDVIDRRFGRRRRYSLRNAKRLALVFALLRAEQAGQADLATYAAIVKRKLLALEGPFHFDWRVLEDPADRPCSIARLLIGARDRARRDTATYLASAKVCSVLEAARRGEPDPFGERPGAARREREARSADALGRGRGAHART